jgi:hypothetical protein
MEKFGQSTIDKYIPTVTAWVLVHDVVVSRFSRYPLRKNRSYTMINRRPHECIFMDRAHLDVL